MDGTSDFKFHGGAILLVLMVGDAGHRYLDERPWRAAFFDNAELSGQPRVITQHDTIDFDWREGPPLVGFTADAFSVRWDACLSVDAPIELTFELGADDGGRLVIDDRIIVDLWFARSYSTRKRRLVLDRGVHHVRVDYFDQKTAARVHLTIDGERLPEVTYETPGPNAVRPCD